MSVPSVERHDVTPPSSKVKVDQDSSQESTNSGNKDDAGLASDECTPTDLSPTLETEVSSETGSTSTVLATSPPSPPRLHQLWGLPTTPDTDRAEPSPSPPEVTFAVTPEPNSQPTLSRATTSSRDLGQEQSQPGRITPPAPPSRGEELLLISPGLWLEDLTPSPGVSAGPRGSFGSSGCSRGGHVPKALFANASPGEPFRQGEAGRTSASGDTSPCVPGCSLLEASSTLSLSLSPSTAATTPRGRTTEGAGGASTEVSPIGGHRRDRPLLWEQLELASAAVVAAAAARAAAAEAEEEADELRQAYSDEAQSDVASEDASSGAPGQTLDGSRQVSGPEGSETDGSTSESAHNWLKSVLRKLSGGSANEAGTIAGYAEVLQRPEPAPEPAPDQEGLSTKVVPPLPFQALSGGDPASDLSEGVCAAARGYHDELAATTPPPDEVPGGLSPVASCSTAEAEAAAMSSDGIDDEEAEYDDELDDCDAEKAVMQSMNFSSPTDSILEALKLEDSHRNADAQHVLLYVPEGMHEDRRVRVQIKNMELEAEVPPGAEVGDATRCELLLTPPMSSREQKNFLICEILGSEHRLRWWRSPDGSWTVDEEERRNKVRAYRSLRGRAMAPALSSIEEVRQDIGGTTPCA